MKIVPTCDDALGLVGGFGLYQFMLLGLLSALTVPATFQFFIMYFVAHNPAWTCVANSTQCLFTEVIKATDRDKDIRCKIDRKEWEFVEEKGYSIVTDFDLTCERYDLIFVASSMFFFAMFISSVPIGWLSDRFGRRKCCVLSISVVLIVSTLSSFSPTYYWFVIARFIVGFFAPATSPLFCILASELTTPKHRPLLVIIIWTSFALALLLMGAVAMVVQEWKYLMLYSTAPYLVLLPFVFFIPESLRWLHTKDRINEANELLRKVDKVNGGNQNIHLSPLKLNDIKISPLLLFNTVGSFLQTINVGFAWFVNSVVYFGITLATSNLSGEIYRDFIFVSLVEFLACIFGIYVASKVGRKKSVQAAMFCGGILCSLVSIIHLSEPNKHLRGLRVALGIIGKFCLTLSFNVIYTWTIELYPTQIRSQAMSFAQLMSRLGGTIAPWVSLWLNKWHWRLPFLIMGSLSITSSVLLCALRETKDMKTAEVFVGDNNNSEHTVEQVELKHHNCDDE